MMSDDNSKSAPRPAPRDRGPERRAVGPVRSRARRPKTAQPQPVDPSVPWASPAPWAAGDDDGVTDRSTDGAADLVNLGFFRAAIRRSRPLWVGLAVLGLLIGAGTWVSRPGTSQAATTLLLTVAPEAQPGTAILNDQAIAQSRGVAAIARRELGLHESVDSLLASYETTVLTDRVLRITVSAPESTQAVVRAGAIAKAFLAFRADQLRTQLQLQSAALDNVLARSQQGAESIAARIENVTARPTSASRRAQLNLLRAAESRATSELVVLKQQVSGAKATAEATTAAMIGQSKVLDAASPLAHSRFKPLILSSLVGLIVGLILGLTVVLVRALVSDRLRRRDDVALALGAPVRLSIARAPLFRRAFRRRSSVTARHSDIDRIVNLLRVSLAAQGRPAGLAVVPVDDAGVAVRSVVALAAALARQDANVVVADLCAGSPAGKLLGVREPGVHSATVADAQLHVVIPERGEITPTGPFGVAAADPDSPVAGDRAAVCSSADVLLTLTRLDPSLAGDHLQSWAENAVVFVTAGRSSWTKVQAVGEMVRLAGTRLVAAVLVGADKWDETLGVASPLRDRRYGSVPDADGDGDGGADGDTPGSAVSEMSS